MSKIIVAIYCIVDDLLKASNHPEDCRRMMSDAEVITTALRASRFLAVLRHKPVNTGKNKTPAFRTAMASLPFAIK